MSVLRLKGENEVRLAAVEGGASDEVLAKINAMPGVLRPLTADEIAVRKVWLCNDRPFKDKVRQFPAAELVKLAGMMSGVPVMAAHPSYMPGREGLPLGTSIDGRVEQDADGVTWLVVRYYVLLEQPFANGRGIVNAIDGGQFKEGSIGFMYESLRCSVCARDLFDEDCEHAPGKEYDGKMCMAEVTGVLEVDEWSFVYSGMVNGTHFRMAASRAAQARDTEDALATLCAKRPRAVDPFKEWMGSAAKAGDRLAAFWGSAGT